GVQTCALPICYRCLDGCERCPEVVRHCIEERRFDSLGASRCFRFAFAFKRGLQLLVQVFDLTRAPFCAERELSSDNRHDDESGQRSDVVWIAKSDTCRRNEVAKESSSRKH